MPDWLHRTPLVVLDELLVAQEWARLLRYVVKRRADFVHSGVLDAGGDSRSDDQYRRSHVLYDLGAWHDTFANRITDFLPQCASTAAQPTVSRVTLRDSADGDAWGSVFPHP